MRNILSFDIEADHESIIDNKILPMINEEGLDRKRVNSRLAIFVTGGDFNNEL